MNHQVPMILTALPHDQVVSTLILNGKVYLRNHYENSSLGWGVDGPGALNIGRVIPGVVGRLDIAGEISQLSSTVAVCEMTAWWQMVYTTL